MTDCNKIKDKENIDYYDKIIITLPEEDKKYLNYMKHNKTDIQTSLAIIEQCYLIIGTRLHTNIIANSFLIPSIHIAYGIKHINYCLTNNLPNSYIPTYIRYLSSDALIEKIRYCIFYSIYFLFTGFKK